MNQGNSPGYEWKIVILLSLLWGIAGLDRMVIAYLFPQIVPDLGLSNTQAGMLTSILSLMFALAVWFSGGLYDRFGPKMILIPATFFFSAMSWIGGIMNKFFTMAIARGLMGLGEGAIYTPSMAIIAEESAPHRRGLNFGIFVCAFPFIGQGLGAIISTQLAASYGWRWTFFLVGIPGMILALLLMKFHVHLTCLVF